MPNLKVRVEKLEKTNPPGRHSLMLELGKIYCECEKIEFNPDDFPVEMDKLTWDDIFTINKPLVEEQSNG